jgi:hypothetical protein
VQDLGGLLCRLDGLLGVQCDGAPLPVKLEKVVGKKVKKAGTLLEKAAEAAAAGKVDKERKLREKAAKQLDTIASKAAKAARARKESRRITEVCRSEIDGRVQQGRQLIGAIVF